MNKWIWLLIILPLFLTVPSLWSEFHVEWNNRTYEIIIPNQEIKEVARQDPDLHGDDVYKVLKQAGLDVISVEPDSLSSLEAKGDIAIIHKAEIQKWAALNHLSDFPTSDGLFIHIFQHNAVTDSIDKVFPDVTPYRINGQKFIFVSGNAEINEERPILFDQLEIQKLRSFHFRIIPRVSNDENEKNPYYLNQLLRMKDQLANGVLYQGKEVVGYPSNNKVKTWTDKLKRHGFHLYTIEFNDQKGMPTATRVIDYNIIRLHSLNLPDQDMATSVDRVIRAVKERNIRAIYLHLTSDEQVASINQTTQFLKLVHQGMPKHFLKDQAKPFAPIHVPLWSIIAAFLSGACYVGVTIYRLTGTGSYGLLAGGIMALLAVLYLFWSHVIVLQMFSLIVAILAPVFSIIVAIQTKRLSTFESMVISYIKAALTALIGVWIIISLLMGNNFLAKIDVFRGVKAVYLLPIILIAIFLFKKDVVPLLKTSIRLWHLGVFIILMLVLYFYILRSGNSGAASTLELNVRQKLEDILYIRPRTKEFLIGYPFFLLGLYWWKVNKHLASICMIPGVIGFLSMVNTFTHLHIPIYISLIRSVYGLVFGFIIGMILILLVRWFIRLLITRGYMREKE